MFIKKESRGGGSKTTNGAKRHSEANIDKKDLEWGEWWWEEQCRCNCRTRQRYDGTWEFEYSYPKDETKDATPGISNVGFGEPGPKDVPPLEDKLSYDDSSRYTLIPGQDRTSSGLSGLDSMVSEQLLPSLDYLLPSEPNLRPEEMTPFLSVAQQFNNISSPSASEGYALTSPYPSNYSYPQFNYSPYITNQPFQSTSFERTFGEEKYTAPINSLTRTGYERSAQLDSSVSKKRNQVNGADFISITIPKSYFKLGRVFMVHLEEWSESSGSIVMVHVNARNADEENAGESTRCFVVVREGLGSAVCCTLQTLRPEEAAKLQSLSITCALGTVSVNQLKPKRNRERSRVDEFPIVLENTSIAFDSELKLDFARPSTVEHSSKVLNIGRIDRDYLKLLTARFSKSMGFNIAKNEEPERLPNEENDTERQMHGMALSLTTQLNLSSSPSDLSVGAETREIKQAPLFPDYKVQPPKAFQFGRVFKILWSEPSGQARRSIGTDVVFTKYGEESYMSIRRFVIVIALEGHCLCLPILTYGRQATKKSGVKPQDHAIIYTERRKIMGPKAEGPKEIEGEEKLSKKPIRVNPLTPRDALDSHSRLNYTKIYTVEYNVKVSFTGSIHEKSLKYFKRDFNIMHPPLPEGPNVESSDGEDK